MLKRVQFFVPWMLGFFLLTNVHLFPSLEISPRATDVLGAVLGLWLLWRFTTRGLRMAPSVTLLILAVVPLLWGLYAYLGSVDTPTVLLSIRWLLAVPWGYALFVIAQNPRYRASLVWGLWWGCVANAIVLLLQFYGLAELTKDFGLAAQESAQVPIWQIVAIDRASGMHNHPNGSAAIVSLIVPLSLYLYYTRKAGIWVVILGLSVLLAGATFTLTRSPLLVSSMIILVLLATNRNLTFTLRLLGLFVLGGLPALYWIGPPGGWQRWLSSGDIETNWGGRFYSTTQALRLSVEHPLGMGSENAQEALLRGTGIGASHNAFLGYAVAYSLPLAVILMSLILVLALQTLRGSRTHWGGLEAILALQLFGLFLWEEHLNNPSFIYLTSWLAAVSVVQISTASKRGSTTWPHSTKRYRGVEPYYDRIQSPRSVSRKA